MSLGEHTGAYPSPDKAAEILAGFDFLKSPVTKGALDEMTGLHIIKAMENIHRAAEYEDGTNQNNASHGFNVALMCMYIGSRFSDELQSEDQPFNLERAINLAIIHDLKEVHAGDTPLNDKELRRSKNLRELAGLAVLLSHLDDDPYMAGLVHEYEEGRTPEARFVHAVDKLEAVCFAINTKAATQRKSDDDFIELAREQLTKTQLQPQVFALTLQAFRILGKKWHDWGCKPFEGDPDVILEAIRREIQPDEQLSFELPKTYTSELM